MSVYPDDGLDAETLIKNADTAMYQAKENGRQSYQFFKPAMNVRAVERQSIEESLRRALERQEFALHYQPKINLRTGAITGAEALLRWTHPTRGSISPAQFIPVAEDCGLILPIGDWVLREACEQARAWVDAGLPATTMAVNVSAMEFRNENFLEGLFAILSETGLDPRSLELELTESVLMKRAESTASILQTLRERGVQVAIDDFGTGYSSLSYLRKFPVDALKIDQSFVRQISTAGDDTTIVTAVIGMARSLKLRVVAEGVETLEELAFLRLTNVTRRKGTISAGRCFRSSSRGCSEPVYRNPSVVVHRSPPAAIQSSACTYCHSNEAAPPPQIARCCRSDREAVRSDDAGQLLVQSFLVSSGARPVAIVACVWYYVYQKAEHASVSPARPLTRPQGRRDTASACPEKGRLTPWKFKNFKQSSYWRATPSPVRTA